MVEAWGHVDFMKTLFTADLHLTANPRDAYRHATIERLIARAKKMGVTRTVILGDLTEEKDRHNDWLTNSVVRHITGFAQLGPVDIDQGNHDYSSDPSCPFFGFLRHLPEVRWFGVPKAGRSTGLGRCLWLPHTRNYKKEWKGLSFEGFDFIFAHGAFTGASLGNNRTLEAGIPHTIFPKGTRVLSGDIHIPHRIGCVTYVGAPYTVDFGDDYEPRVLIYDDETDKITSHPVEGPQKRLLHFDWTKGELDKIDALNDGDIIKIKVSMPRKAAAGWPKAREELRRIHSKRFHVHSIVPVIVEDPGARVRIGKAVIKSDEQVVRDFAHHRGIDKRTLKQGEKLL